MSDSGVSKPSSNSALGAVVPVFILWLQRGFAVLFSRVLPMKTKQGSQSGSLAANFFVGAGPALERQALLASRIPETLLVPPLERALGSCRVASATLSRAGSLPQKIPFPQQGNSHKCFIGAER